MRDVSPLHELKNCWQGGISRNQDGLAPVRRAGPPALRRQRMARWYLVLILLVGGQLLATVILAAGLNVSNTTTTDSLNPAVAVAADGTVHLAWEESNGFIYYRAYANGTWGSVQALVQGDSPALAVDGNGTVHLVWVDEDFNQSFNIFYMQKPATGDWSPPTNISKTTGASSAPDIAVTSGGAVHIVWVDSTPGQPTIYYSDLSTGGPISGSPTGIAPRIALDGAGKPHVVWEDTDTPSSILYTSRTPTGWSIPENLSGAGTSDAVAPQIAISGSTVYVLWSEGGAIRATQGSSQNWVAPQTISGSDTDAQLSALTIDGNGHVHAAWVDGTSRLRYARQPAGGAWELPITLLSGANGLVSVAASGDAGYTAHIAWAATATTLEIFYDTKPVATLLGDLNGDCNINVADIIMEASQLGAAVTDPAYNFDGDDTVGIGDVAQVAMRWRLTCPTP